MTWVTQCIQWNFYCQIQNYSLFYFSQHLQRVRNFTEMKERRISFRQSVTFFAPLGRRTRNFLDDQPGAWVISEAKTHPWGQGAINPSPLETIPTARYWCLEEKYQLVGGNWMAVYGNWRPATELNELYNIVHPINSFVTKAVTFLK